MLAAAKAVVPDAPDDGGPRGIALEFRLADGGKQHMTTIRSSSRNAHLAAAPQEGEKGKNI